MKDPHVQVAMLTNEVCDLRDQLKRLQKYARHHSRCFRSFKCGCGLDDLLAQLGNVPAGLANERVAVEDGSEPKMAVEPPEGQIDTVLEGR